jgi:hypothetical protein
MNYDREWQVSSMTSGVSVQLRDFGSHSNLGLRVGDLGGAAEETSTSKIDELDVHEIKVGEWDKIGYLPSSSFPFYFALAIGSIVAGIAAGWTLGLHQLSGSSPATIEQKQIIAEMSMANEPTTSRSHSQDSVPIVASREPEPSTSPAPIRAPRPSTKILPPKTKHDRASPETSSVVAPQRGKTLAEPVPETKPRTIEGWMIRDVAGNTVVLEGPRGVWRATRGETVPGVGKVDSIVRWGNRWIVSTSRGLISTQ